eukprot:GILI01006879.1.p1 GENE.GILI01006879.1~~GILI01006879.1.p1  ORF type:complete len:532 (+),score=153.60 GILI01006879.1:56-1651(+)
MPPKRRFDDDDDDRTTESTESEASDDSDASTTPQNRIHAVDTSAGGQVGGQTITNNPHDMAFEVEDDTEHKTPPEGSLHGSGATKPSAIGGSGAATAGAPGGGSNLMNNPNDEAFEVEGARNVPTPQAGGADAATGRVGAPASIPASGGGTNKVIKNDKHDEFSDVEDDDEEEDADTPPRSSQPNRGPNAPGNATIKQPPAVAGGNTISNDHHDEGFEVDGSSAATTPERNNANGNTSNSNNSATASNVQPQHTPANAASSKAANGQMRPDDDEDEDSSDVETSEDDDDVNASGGAPVMGAIEAAAQQQQSGALEYNPKDYEYLRKKVPADVLELFSLIDGFQATEMDLPAKFRPFVPEFIPCVGDLDAFCKVPRPDGLPDGFGLLVIDEPSLNQANPAVIKMGLANIALVPGSDQNVTTITDAATRPGLVDRWVSEIKELHTKKPLPSVNYSKPMPDIEELLQIWPAEFEELLSSDLQFPPPQIDLDIEQHCRVMCAMLDIPVYDNIIESLHVMFSLFVEFRANQHFQHV